MKVKKESEKAGLKLNIQKTKIMASGLITSWHIDRETMKAETDFIFLGSKITAGGGDYSHEIKTLLLGRKPMINLDSILNKKRHYFANKGLSSQRYGFSSSHVWTWELDHKEGWVLKNWCFWTVVLEETRESPLDCKEIQPDHPKGDQSWIFTERTDAEAEAPILWPPDAMSRLIKKDPEAGKEWRQEVKGTKEDKMVGWHHWPNGHEFEQAPGDGEGQGSLRAVVHGITKSWKWLSDWKPTTRTLVCLFISVYILYMKYLYSSKVISVLRTLKEKRQCWRIQSHKTLQTVSTVYYARGSGGIGSQQGPRWFWRTWCYALRYTTAYMLVIIFTTRRCRRINSYNMQVQALSFI